MKTFFRKTTAARIAGWSICLGLLVANLDSPAAAVEVKTIDLKVLQSGKIIVDGKHEIALADLLETLQRETKLQSLADDGAGGDVVLLSSDPNATYSNFSQVVNICAEVGYERFVLAFDRNYDWCFRLTAPVDAKPDESALPPLKIQLKANSDGGLAPILFNQQRMVTPQKLHEQIVLILDVARRQGNIAAKIELELDADPALQMRHVTAVYAAIAGSTDADGKFTPLIRRIAAFRVDGEEEEEIEDFCEESVVEEDVLELEIPRRKQ